ncbi:homeobox KN domain-containing protein [Xylaria venustula]|nr:homeobox KN domain-containing protein [Xylaria venustula]
MRREMPPPYYNGPAFPCDILWPQDDARPKQDEPFRLPPIRQAFSDYKLEIHQDIAVTPPSATSPTEPYFNGAQTPPEYVHSPSRAKRRRRSDGVKREFETNSQIPRHYDLTQAGSRPQSPTCRSGVMYSGNPSSHAQNFTLPFVGPRVTAETHERAEIRRTLPSLPGLGEGPHLQSYPYDGHMPESSRRFSFTATSGHCGDFGGQGYRPGSFGYGHNHPNRHPSFSVGPAPFDRTPFSPGTYGPNVPRGYMHMGDFGPKNSEEGRPRKRRGNLPKEVTDKLRAWFLSHLKHPYPTEEEKQDMVRRTGLHMNQVSNWFINARRRQLPNMINDARVESNATRARPRETEIEGERTNHDLEANERSDDTEGSNYDCPEMEPPSQHQPADSKRGSI